MTREGCVGVCRLCSDGVSTGQRLIIAVGLDSFGEFGEADGLLALATVPEDPQVFDGSLALCWGIDGAAYFAA